MASLYLLLTRCVMLFRYRPSLTLEFIQTELGYDDDSDTRDDLLNFLVNDLGATLSADKSKIDCKNGLNPPSAQS